MQSEKDNEYKGKGGYRYLDNLKIIFTYLFIVGGSIFYEILSANFFIPSKSSVARTIHSHFKELFEGPCRAQDLKQFLQLRNLPFTVWLSEDATRITGRIQCNPNSNQIVGFFYL